MGVHEPLVKEDGAFLISLSSWPMTSLALPSSCFVLLEEEAFLVVDAGFSRNVSLAFILLVVGRSNGSGSRLLFAITAANVAFFTLPVVGRSFFDLFYILNGTKWTIQIARTTRDMSHHLKRRKS
jgi:hypothetical protein